eukprot:7734534-Pyramimonas_sp.AAC.1
MPLWHSRITHAVMSPVDLGFPMLRPRQFTILTLKGVVCLGRSWDDFFSMFGRKVVASPQCVWDAPREYTRE